MSQSKNFLHPSVFSHLSPEELVSIITRQSSRIEELSSRLESLEKRNQELESRLGKLLAEDSESPPRSVAPFRRDESKLASSPKRPGRPKGHPGSFRQAPEPTERVEVPLESCPGCGGGFASKRALEQIIEEIPEVTPRAIQLTTYEGRCSRRGTTRSTHPLQVSTATGAAKVCLGPNALSLATRLQHRFSLSKRKTCELLQDFFGLSLTPGGLVHASHRMARRLRPEFEELERRARESAVLHSDETGWYVGKPGYSLWVFTNQDLTLYRVVERKTRERLKRIVGENFAGVLVSDCLSIYNEVCPLQQKCYSHHLKAISDAIKSHPNQGKGYLMEWRFLLKLALALKETRGEPGGESDRKRLKLLRLWSERLLQTPRQEFFEERIRKRLLKQEEHLFVFLERPEVDATNNLAERELRPAVIARKLSCGNTTRLGADTFETLASITRTATRNAKSLRDLLQVALQRHIAPVPR